MHLVSIAFVVTGSLCSMVGDEHMRVWKCVFGLPERLDGRVRDSLYRISNALDEDYYLANHASARIGEVLNEIPCKQTEVAATQDIEIEEVCQVRWSLGQHRIFFHWGFRAEPEKHRPLEEFINKKLDECPCQEEVKQTFLEVVRTQWAEVKREIGNTVSRLFHVTNDAHVEAIAILVWDTHILADYSTTDTEYLASVTELKSEIVQALQILAAGQEQREKWVAQIANTPPTGSSRQWAQQLLQQLAEILPMVMYYGNAAEGVRASGLYPREPKPVPANENPLCDCVNRRW